MLSPAGAAPLDLVRAGGTPPVLSPVGAAPLDLVRAGGTPPVLSPVGAAPLDVADDVARCPDVADGLVHGPDATVGVASVALAVGRSHVTLPSRLTACPSR